MNGLDGTILPGGAVLRVADAAEPAELVAPNWSGDPEHPPTALAAAIASRTALRGAVRRLKTRRSDEAPVLAAIERGDETGVLTALVGLAVGRFLDSELGRDGTAMAAWSSAYEYRIQREIFRNPGAVSSLPADTPDLPYLIALAAEAAIPSGQMFNATTGQPARNRPGSISLNRLLIR